MVQIKNANALYNEGLDMKHCIYSYKDKIMSENCYIYSIKDNDIRSTLEIILKNEKFYIIQLRSIHNQNIDNKTYSKIQKILDTFNN